jgi:hypothetical protein
LVKTLTIKQYVLMALEMKSESGPLGGRDVVDIAGCSLAELMEDPLTALVMKSDGVDRRDLELLLEQVARKRLLATQLANPRRPRLTAETAPC